MNTNPNGTKKILLVICGCSAPGTPGHNPRPQSFPAKPALPWWRINLFITALGARFQRLIPLSVNTFKMADYDHVKLTFEDGARLLGVRFDDGFVTAVKRQ